MRRPQSAVPLSLALLVKLALVSVVALMGYANNRYALPALDAWRPGTARLLRRTVAAEAAVMVAVLLVTAVLVASPSGRADGRRTRQASA